MNYYDALTAPTGRDTDQAVADILRTGGSRPPDYTLSCYFVGEITDWLTACGREVYISTYADCTVIDISNHYVDTDADGPPSVALPLALSRAVLAVAAKGKD